jgi:hypothetical protein
MTNKSLGWYAALVVGETVGFVHVALAVYLVTTPLVQSYNAISSSSSVAVPIVAVAVKAPSPLKAGAVE